MALKLERELDTGVVADYWRIGSVVVACSNNPTVTIYMELFLNRELRYSGRSSVLTQAIGMNLSQIDPTFDYDFRACVYNALNNDPNWSSAKYIYEFDETYETRPIVNYIDVNADYNDTTVIPNFQGQDLNNLPLTFEIVDQPTNGSIVENNGVYVYTPNLNWYGSDIATYRCFNGTEYSKPAKIYFKVLNPVPTANSFSAQSNYNGSSVLNFQASDPNNLPLTFDIVNQPSNGQITENNGIFTYTPNADWSGSDVAFYTANNGTYQSNQASIFLTVLSDVPTATGMTVSCDVNSSVSGNLEALDPNNIALTYQIIDQPSNGNVVLANNSFTYTPSQDFTGSDSFTFTVDNGIYTSNLATVNITVL